MCLRGPITKGDLNRSRTHCKSPNLDAIDFNNRALGRYVPSKCKITPCSFKIIN